MRDVILLFSLVAGFGATFVYPYAGVIFWAWLSLMIPQSLAYGFLQAAPINFGVAGLTLARCFLSGEKKQWPSDALPILTVLFLIWMAINSAVAPYPEWSADKLEITMRSYPLIFLCLIMTGSKSRVLSLVWTIVISLGYYGVKGGVFTIVTGGNYHVVGSGGIYPDNNQLALALTMVIPLIQYLWANTKNRPIRLCLLAALILQTVSVLGTYSRGGLIALCAMMVATWFRSKHKLLYLVLGAVLLGGALSLMPPQFFVRMSTIQQAGSDDSFIGRLEAWQVCYLYAIDHFPFGSGFNGNYHPDVFHRYFPGADTHLAHSIFFQVLGDHGFPGLFLYLLIALAALRNAYLVARRCRGQADLAWAGGLASALMVSQIAFYVGGAALSVPYWDGILLVQALTSILRALTEPRPPRSGSSPQLVKERDALQRAHK